MPSWIVPFLYAWNPQVFGFGTIQQLTAFVLDCLDQ